MGNDKSGSGKISVFIKKPREEMKELELEG